MKIGDYVRSKRSFGAINGFVLDFFKNEVLVKPADGGEETWFPIDEFYVDNQHKKTYEDWWEMCMIDDFYPGPLIEEEELNDILTDQLIFLSESIETIEEKSFENVENYLEAVIKLNEQLNETVNSLLLAKSL